MPLNTTNVSSTNLFNNTTPKFVTSLGHGTSQSLSHGNASSSGNVQRF